MWILRRKLCLLECSLFMLLILEMVIDPLFLVWNMAYFFFLIGQLFSISWLYLLCSILVIRPAFYGIHIILIMHCWFLKLRRNIFYGYSFNCMDMIIHENKTRLKGSGVVLLSACCHAAVAPLFLPTQPRWIGMYFQVFIKRVSGSQRRN
jgi:hypothetical protein